MMIASALDSAARHTRSALTVLENSFNRAAARFCGPHAGAPRLCDLVIRLPLAGSIGGSVVAHAPRVLDPELGSSMSLAPSVMKFIVADSDGAPANVGRKVKNIFFKDYPPFVFNVSFACGRAGRRMAGVYADEGSVWFNSFFGAYEIVAPKRDWARPFGYELKGGQSFVHYEDIVRIGKADWNYFSNYLYGVPESEITPHNEVRSGAGRFTYCGRKPVNVAQGHAGSGRLWDTVELDGVEVVSARISSGEMRRLENWSPLFTPLLRLAFGRPTAGSGDESFTKTRMRALLRMCFSESPHPQYGDTYRTVIIGAAVSDSHTGAAGCARLLRLQVEATDRVIERYYPHLGFEVSK